jgi:hypothetical protein
MNVVDVTGCLKDSVEAPFVIPASRTKGRKIGGTPEVAGRNDRPSRRVP